MEGKSTVTDKYESKTGCFEKNKGCFTILIMCNLGLCLIKGTIFEAYLTHGFIPQRNAKS